MTTHPTPAPEGYISTDMLPPEDGAYAERLKRALRCGVDGCLCANPGRFHCPSHDNAEVPTLSVTWKPDRGFNFECFRCSWPQILDALAKRSLMPRSQLYNTAGAVEAGLQPLELLIQQPPDWLWPNRIPLGKLTLIAGYPSSGKTSIALDVAARVSRGAPAPDQPDALFPSAPVALALLNGNPKSDVLPVLRLFGADLARIYLADLITPKLPIDYYPDDPPPETGPDDPDDDDEDWDDEDDEEYLFDNDGNEIRAPRRRKPVGVRLRARDPFEPPPRAASDYATPWPGLNKIMKRLANTVEAGSAALLVVDQVEDLASMHRAHVSTVLGMLKALAARTGAAVLALTHNPAKTFPRAVTAMERRLAQASVVFTTALVEPGERRFLVPLRPAMSDDAPAIPFVLPPAPSSSFLRRQEPRSPSLGSPSPATPPSFATPASSVIPPSSATPASSVIPAKAGIQSPPSQAFTVTWRKPILPAHLKALATPRPNDGAKTRAAQALLLRALADGPRPASDIEREAAMQGIAKRTLRRARLASNIKATRTGASNGPGAGTWQWSLPPRVDLQQDETPK